MLRPPVLRRATYAQSRWARQPALQEHVAKISAVSSSCTPSCCTSWPSCSSSNTSCQRRFASTAFGIRRQNQASIEHTLFVVGLNEAKFFGQDGAEEGLKLLERVVEHHQEYDLLFGISEKALATMEADHPVGQNRKLTPSRELEQIQNGEMIPMMQASMVDKCKRRAVDRPVKTTQSHVAHLLWKFPRETIKLGWAYRRRKDHKDAARHKFWSQHFPLCSTAYFDERAEIISIRTVEHIVARRSQEWKGAIILVVGNEVFSLVNKQLSLMLADEGRQLSSPAFMETLRSEAVHLCADVIDFTPVLIFVYCGIPLITLHFTYLAVEYYVKQLEYTKELLKGEDRD
mmetsp:Transcript_100354/g.199087  ORF Transcript_100354/g.199087 Transcript_100354/m.199087 type:complete len:345 (+) Transcript_100354:99-1133(+)